jgi:hypothetical protein
MTRQEFIKLVKADLKAQRRQVMLLMGLVLIFSLVGMSLVNRASDQILHLRSQELWLLLALTVLVAALAVVGLRLTGKALLRCPHCRKCLGGISSQVVVACGRCGFCGMQIIDED